MSIDFVNFTPLALLIGGLLIGISIITLHFFFKRIAGISGIINSLLTKIATLCFMFSRIITVFFFSKT